MQPRDVFLGTQERVRNSRGERAISVRATEVLLYLSILAEEHPVRTNATAPSACLASLQQKIRIRQFNCN